MSLLAKCPGCGRSYDVGERHVGKKAKCADCGASFELRPDDEPTSASSAKGDASKSASRAVRRTRIGSGSSEIRLPPKRGGAELAPPPVVRAVAPSPPGLDGSSPPVRAVQPGNIVQAVQPAGPVIATHEPAGAASRVVGRRSRGSSGLIVAGLVVVGVAATIGILFALGVFDGADHEESPTVASGGEGNGGSNSTEPSKTGNPPDGQANPSTPATADPTKNGTANPTGSDPTDPPTSPSGEPVNETSEPATEPGITPIEPIPAGGKPSNAGKQGGFPFRLRGKPIALYEVDAEIVPKEPQIDVIQPEEEITGPKLESGAEFEITCIQKQAFLGFVKGADGQKQPGKISRDDIEFDDENTYLFEDEDSVLYLQNRVVELTRGEEHGVAELSVVANSLLEDTHMKHVANLPYLKKASFLDAKVGDAGMVHLAGLVNLEFLSFSGTSGVGDETLPHLKHLTKLKELRLDGTKVSDAGLGHLAAMPWLTRVVLTNTDVTDEGAKRLKATLKKTEVVR